jgi:hypothetical protein
MLFVYYQRKVGEQFFPELLVHVSFYDLFSIPDYIPSDGRISDELQGTWKEAFIA